MDATKPSQILIVRHGEKLGNSSNDDVGGPHLSIAGSVRAVALPELFAPQSPALSCNLVRTTHFSGTYVSIDSQGPQPRFSTPAFLYAAKASNNSNRPVETITPLSVALQMSVNDSYKKSDYGGLATDLLTGSRYSGKVILICWHHGMIPNLAKALGVANPPSWPGAVFDRVWKITYPDGEALLANLPQQLLHGDSNS
jgi:hypothetical protein